MKESLTQNICVLLHRFCFCWSVLSGHYIMINLIECQPQCVYANPHITLTSLSNEKITIENSFLAFYILTIHAFW